MCHVVITKLQGGLGNQMFQYSAGKMLAIKNNSTLKLDISWYLTQNKRQYALHHFMVTEIFAKAEEVKRLLQFNRFSLRNITCKLAPKLINHKLIYIKQTDSKYCPSVFSAKGDVYLEGYWQNPDYFSEIQETLRRDFVLKEEAFGKNAEILRIIRNSNSASIHFRRGDYVYDNKTRMTHPICSDDYYNSAIKILNQNFKDLIFFIFSDDIDWVKKNVIISNPTFYVDWNKEENSFEDLRLMSSCRHNIIANSTFSWWGAWLNSNPGKVVIAPEKWFADPEINKQTTDLIPEKWIRL